MYEYAEKNKLLTQPRRTLVGSFFGEKNLLATPLVKWYLEHGLVVHNVTLIIEYTPKQCFKQFGEQVSNARRQGDLDSSQSILADTFKLLGNSAYGKSLTNIAKHRDIHYVTSEQTKKLVNESRFQKLTELSEDVAEAEMSKKKINWALPLQIGYFVYQHAKLRMMQFYYDFLDKFDSREDFQLLEMGTDSSYMALSRERFEDVRPHLREQFYKEYSQWFPGQACDKHYTEFQMTRLAKQPWNPAQCSDCLDRVRYDNRTPGLFKTEYTGALFQNIFLFRGER